ncbi:MAG: preprotein translocase subunit SecG [Litorimonas sp.]
MSTVLLVILLIISIIMTGLILIQRSEGGALGIGGGGGGGTGFMSGRAATTSIARMTAILGTVFLILSLLLSVVFALENNNSSRLDVDDEVGGLTQTLDSTEGTAPLDVTSPPADSTDPDE